MLKSNLPVFPSSFTSPLSLSFSLQGKIVAQGRLLLQDTFMVSDQDGGLLSRMKERRVFLFEQIVIFSEPLDKKKGFSTPGYLFKNSIKVWIPVKNKHEIWYTVMMLPVPPNKFLF